MAFLHIHRYGATPGAYVQNKFAPEMVAHRTVVKATGRDIYTEITVDNLCRHT